MKGVAKDVSFLDWQFSRYVSPAIDILYNIFTSTEKALRDKEYENFLELYHESLSKTVKLLGSNPDELFTFKDLTNELEKCGNYALMMAPCMLHVSLAQSAALIPDLNKERQLEFDRRINGVFEDIVE